MKENIEVEFGSSTLCRFMTKENVKLTDQNGNEILCECGEKATCGIISLNANLDFCSECFSKIGG